MNRFMTSASIVCDIVCENDGSTRGTLRFPHAYILIYRLSGPPSDWSRDRSVVGGAFCVC